MDKATETRKNPEAEIMITAQNGEYPVNVGNGKGSDFMELGIKYIVSVSQRMKRRVYDH